MMCIWTLYSTQTDRMFLNNMSETWHRIYQVDEWYKKNSTIIFHADIEVLRDPGLELPNTLDLRARGIGGREGRLVAIVACAKTPRPWKKFGIMGRCVERIGGILTCIHADRYDICSESLPAQSSRTSRSCGPACSRSPHRPAARRPRCTRWSTGRHSGLFCSWRINT